MSNPPNSAAAEAMARAIKGGVGGGAGLRPSLYLEAAQAALTALCALHPGIGAVLDGGAVVVPREATRIMVDAAYDAYERLEGEPACYRAMLAASPYAPPPSPDAAEGA